VKRKEADIGEVIVILDVGAFVLFRVVVCKWVECTKPLVLEDRGIEECSL
jgi:hypothetical protein